MRKTISELAGSVEQVEVASIRRNEENPRGQVRFDESFTRLLDSIAKVGLLVPLVVRELPRREGTIAYELVDGERRFLACKRLGVPKVPAHILASRTEIGSIRQLMFHLHMTREQWTPLAQCRALAEEHEELELGLTFDEKEQWALEVKKETGMPLQTARDRVHVLAWPKELKQRFYAYGEHLEASKRDVYSYILALEVSIVEPSRVTFKQVYNGKMSIDEGANRVRASLYDKLVFGLENDLIRNRDQIRQITPLFNSRLAGNDYVIALGLFKDLVDDPSVQFDDVRYEMDARLPFLAKESAPKPKRLLSSVRKWEATLRSYERTYIDEATISDTEADQIASTLAEGLLSLSDAANDLAERLG